jgi:hypothetical protein
MTNQDGTYETYQYLGDTTDLHIKEIYSAAGLLLYRELWLASGASQSILVQNGYTYTTNSIVTDTLTIGGSSTLTTNAIVADTLTIGSAPAAASSAKAKSVTKALVPATVSPELQSKMSMLAQHGVEEASLSRANPVGNSQGYTAKSSQCS